MALRTMAEPQQTTPERPELARRPSAYWIALCVITLLALALRAGRLDDPMRYDESYTFIYFAAPATPQAWFNYPLPNNHVLHTLAVHLSMRLLGPEPWAVRIPAFMAGVALVPSAAWLAWLLARSRVAGLFAAALVASSSLLVEYSANARGYSMVALATVLMAAFALEIARGHDRARTWIGFVLAGALGAYAVPVMAYPIGILIVSILLHWLLHRPERGLGRSVVRLAAWTAVMAALIALLYLPVLIYTGMNDPGSGGAPLASGIKSLTANKFVAPRPRAQVWSQLGPAMTRALSDWVRDTSWAWRVVVVAGLGAALGRALGWRHPFWALPFLAAVLLPAAALAQRVVPYPRVWLFLFPLCLCVAAAGVQQLLELIRRRGSPEAVGKDKGTRPVGFARSWGPWAVVGLIVVACADAMIRTSWRDFLVSEEPRTLVDAEAIVADLAPALDGSTAIISESPAWPSLWYYVLMQQRPYRDDGRDPSIRAAAVVVGELQELDTILNDNPILTEQYAPPKLWKEYPHAKVYLSVRKGSQ